MLSFPKKNCKPGTMISLAKKYSSTHVPVHFVGNQPDNLGERLYMKPNRVPGLPGLRQQ